MARAPRASGMRRVLKAVAVLVGLVLVYVAVAGAWAYAVTPTVLELASKPPLIEMRSLPKGTVDILLRVEDPTFRKRKGINPFTPGQGLVTLPHALAHLLYLDRYDLTGVAGVFQSMYRFVDRVAGAIDLGPDAMALALNARVGKDRQIRLFLQHVYMGTHEGKPVYGFANAARIYFGKRVPELSRRYVVALVGMMVAPDRFHPVRHPDALAERISRIERLLRGDCKPKGVRDVYYDDCAATAHAGR